MESPLRVLQSPLAVLVLLIAAITFLELPQPYPTWPTIGSIPVDPELIVPGALALVALSGAIRAGLTLGSIVIGLLSAVTLWIASMSWYALYTPSSGGVFWGGFFTLVSGSALAIAILVRRVVRQRASPTGLSPG